MAFTSACRELVCNVVVSPDKILRAFVDLGFGESVDHGSLVLRCFGWL